MKINRLLIQGLNNPIFISSLGISFWFFLAFPFGARNEGYLWFWFMEKHTFIEAIATKMENCPNNRPLVQMIGWLLYHISGNTIPFQIFSYSVLIFAFYVIIYKSDLIKELSFFYFLIGFVFITSFYYIFNINLIGLILLYIAYLIRQGEDIVKKWKNSLMLAIFVSFAHPFMIPIFILFFWGTVLEMRIVEKKRLLYFLFSTGILIILMKMLYPGSGVSLISIKNLLGSMRNVEINLVVKATMVLFCFIASLNKNKSISIIIQVMILLFLPFAFVFNIPVFILFVTISAIKLILNRKWAIMGVLLAGILYALVTEWGAPTKCIILIFISPILLCINNPAITKLNISKFYKFTFPLTLLLFIVIILTRLGVTIPLFTNTVKPLLTEREKTIQLEKCIKIAFSERKRIIFLQSHCIQNIRDEGLEFQRSGYPPTSQYHLDLYLMSIYKTRYLDSIPKVFISFGKDVQSDSLNLVYTIKEKWSETFVYEKGNLRTVDPN